MMLSVLFNKKRQNPFIGDRHTHSNKHSHTDTYKDRDRLVRQPSGRHRFSLMHQTDKTKGREHEVETSNLGSLLVQ